MTMASNKPVKKIRFLKLKFREAVIETAFNTMADKKRRIGMREFAPQIGISPATLSRVMNGGEPDINTFFKLCYWMKRSSNEFYNY